MEVFLKLQALLESFASHDGLDRWGAYRPHLGSEKHTAGKYYTSKPYDAPLRASAGSSSWALGP